MKNFLAGLAIGLPLGMLLSDVLSCEPRSEMAERMRAIATEARQRAAEITARPRTGTLSEPGCEQGVAQALNSATREELLGVYGIGAVLVDRIMQGRPYRSEHDVIERGILDHAGFERLRRELLDRYRKSA